ncbi:helix-turn-helix domain-containing protein [Streptomyces sp. TRM68367]|uniref:winged helix-turn-helix domain-containing protein n=1 Tax=Streptomyces sp. TRM68367 TaxID=2758415 RepID=UPI00165BF254|nr:helix-turn-helix domain-containing protein [Streptomyces sp. TRM68367]MBC9725539.1 helix-turn-helix transcriptional regulator [Streptomyces sp. TRM68367]
MPEEHSVHKLDARSLRGLAHPLRMQLLRTLKHHGPATASMLAERLGESSGATSYHLRQLAEYGFVEDVPERGKGRERWWQAAVQGLTFDENLLHATDPATRGAVDTYMHEVATNHARELSTWVATREEWLPAWSHSTDLSDWTLRLTPERALGLIEKMQALLASYQNEPDTTPGAETVRVHTHLFPFATD